MPQPPDDDERTIMRPPFAATELPRDSGVGSTVFGHTLVEGTRLGEFEITGLIGEGGFGIVYLAYDLALQRQVAVKEYMPSSLASRANGSVTVAAKSERHRDTFNAGLRSFINEARLLARFDHPALVKVYRFWEANGTAYMVMPYYQGPTLKQALADMRQPPSEQALLSWLSPLLDALSTMHAVKCYHRDIAPDNILLTDAGPLLLDFGAARRVVGDMTHALTVVLKPGYAPIEQYGEAGAMTQGAWTDLYALACVVYFAITGKTPMSSVERLMGDRLQALNEVAAGRYDARFLRAIDSALAVRPEQRPQSVAEFQALIEPATLAGATVADTRPRFAAAPISASTQRSPSLTAADPVTVPMGLPPQPATTRSLRYTAWIASLLAIAALGAAVWYMTHRATDPAASRPAETSAAPIPAVPTATAAPAEAATQEPPASAPITAAEQTTAESTATTAATAAATTDAVLTVPSATTATPSSQPAREPVARRTTVKPPNRTSTAPRCSDILQKASLETLSREESDYLKRECR